MEAGRPMEAEKAALIRAIRERDALLQDLEASAARLAAENRARAEGSGLLARVEALERLAAERQALERQAAEAAAERAERLEATARLWKYEKSEAETEAEEVRRKYGPHAKVVATRLASPFGPLAAADDKEGGLAQQAPAAAGAGPAAKREAAARQPAGGGLPEGRHVVSNALLTASRFQPATWMQLQGHLANVYPITEPPSWPPEGLVGGSLNYLDIDRVEKFGPFHRHGREPVHWTGNAADAWYSAPRVALQQQQVVLLPPRGGAAGGAAPAAAAPAYPASDAGFLQIPLA